MSPKPVRPQKQFSAISRFALGIAFAVTYGIATYLVIWMSREGAMALISGLILAPMGIASAATAISDPTGEGDTWSAIVSGWIAISAVLVLSMLLFGETAICVIMAAPFLALGSALGSLTTKQILRYFHASRPVNLVIALPLMIFPLEQALPYPTHHGSVTTVIEIAAPPEQVWNHTVAIPHIAPDELPFTFGHGIVGVPHPIDARMNGTGVGAVRDLRWTGDVTFQEIVTEWDQDRRLGWDFHFGPESIPASVEQHISVTSDYLQLTSGDYTLTPLPGGRTRLELTTHYTVRTALNAYCAMWGRIFLGDFHHSVLTVIQARSEGATG